MEQNYSMELRLANVFYKMYLDRFNEIIDEMKLHKLMYFLQRESLIQTGQPLFEEQFEGWKYGPVLISVRKAYRQQLFEQMGSVFFPDTINSIVNQVFDRYAVKESWSLSRITHGEYAWLQSRKGLIDGESGNKKILVSDMRIDAERVSARREMRRRRHLE